MHLPILKKKKPAGTCLHKKAIAKLNIVIKRYVFDFVLIVNIKK